MKFLPVSFSFILSIFFVNLLFAQEETQRGDQKSSSGNTTAAMEEIVVTGDLRDTNQNRLGVTITVVTADEIDALQAQHLEEIISRIPNMNLASGGSRARFYQIRGIGERGQFSEPLNSSVGLVIDGVDFSGRGSAATLFDVDQVEVFKGPQGTLYGANALAGLININTARPTDRFTSKLSLRAANYNSVGIGAAVSGPFNDSVKARLSVYQNRSDGFIDNVTLNKDTQTQDELSLRGKLSWQPGDAWQIGLSLGWLNLDNGYDAFSLDNDRKTRSDEPGHDIYEAQYVSVNANWSGSGVDVFTQASHVNSDTEYGYDEDWTFTGFHPFGYTSTDNYLRDRTTQTLEVRVASQEPISLGLLVDWTAGAFWLNQKVDLLREYTFAAQDFASQYDFNRRAVFGEINLHLSETLNLKLGLRGENHQAEYRDSNSINFSPDDFRVSYRVVLESQFNEDTFGYVSVSSGNKSAGFNTSGTLAPQLREYEAETLDNFEVGVKAQLFDGLANLSASVFWMQRDDVQLSRSFLLIRGDGSTEFVDYVDNASNGFNRGVEIELDAWISGAVQVFANIGWLDTKFEDYENVVVTGLEGREQAHAPEFQYSAGITWQLTDTFSGLLELDGKSAYFFSNTHQQRSDSYTLVAASLKYQRGPWAFSVWGKNLGDAEYQVRGFFFGNDPRTNYTSSLYTQLGEPRRYGVSVSAEF